MPPQELIDQLARQLSNGFKVWKSPHGGRTLLLRDVADDLQAGFNIDKGKTRGAWIEVVDIGVRIPTVEDSYDRYEIYTLREMGARNPKPAGWLTFWRPTHSFRELEERGLKVDAIQGDFAELYERIAGDPVEFRARTLDLLCEARRPDWATEPGSAFLIIKALVARTLRNPEIDACDHVADLLKNEPVIEGYMINIERFCAWLRSDRHGS